jgi:hypothetical protein
MTAPRGSKFAITGPREMARVVCDDFLELHSHVEA